MSADEIDYQAVLADLEAKKAKIEAAIEVIRQMVVGGTSPSTAVGVRSLADLPGDAFFNMSIPDAIRKLLRIAKRKLTTSEIATALERGGYSHTSSNFANTVRTTLARSEKKDGDIVRVGNDWGLAEWYPGRRRKDARGRDSNGESIPDKEEE